MRERERIQGLDSFDASSLERILRLTRSLVILPSLSRARFAPWYLTYLETFTHPLYFFFFFPLCFVCFFTYKSSFAIHGSSLYGVWQSGRKETVLDLAKFVDRGVSVKLSGGRQGEKKTPSPLSALNYTGGIDRLWFYAI